MNKIKKKNNQLMKLSTVSMKKKLMSLFSIIKNNMKKNKWNKVNKY